MSWFSRNALYFSWLIAFSGAILSFYFGEIEKIRPCPLCWYQRMCLFPLAVILGIAAYRTDRGIVFYALPLSLIGVLLAFYQSLEPYFAILRGNGICGEKECTESVFLIGGFLSFPIVSGIGFLLISIFLCLGKK